MDEVYKILLVEDISQDAELIDGKIVKVFEVLHF